VKVFLDECVDWRLGPEITGHKVRTARQMGWTTLKNGELLELASTGFDVFVTLDRNLPAQHHLSAFSLAVVVLRPKSSRLADLRPLFPSLLIAIDTARPGAAVVVSADNSAGLR
jgi:hypothetical protein